MMEDMIRKLVDVDRDCAKRVEAAKQKKLDIQKNVSKQRQAIFETFINEQNLKVEEHKRKLEQINLEDETTEKKVFEQKVKQLDKKYQENKDSWIQGIVERCLQ